MTVTKTVNIPAGRRLTIDVPREVPVGWTILDFTPASNAAAPETDVGECPICAKHRDPRTGNPRYNAETVAAIEEGMAISRGEIPAKWYDSPDEMWADLMTDDPDD